MIKFVLRTVCLVAVAFITGCTCNKSVNPNEEYYTLTIEINPADGGEVSRYPDLTSYAAGTEITVTATANDGYTFTGWTGVPEDIEASNAEITLTMPADTLTLIANFDVSAISHTVIYNGNGNTGGIAPTDDYSPYLSGSTVTVLDAGNLIRTGYTFSGWNTAADGSGASYVAGNTFNITGNATLYARWTAVETSTYAVMVSSVAGIGVSGSGNYAAGQIVNISAGMSPDGQRFTNWTATPAVNFANANHATTTFIMPANEVMITANFETITYTVIWTVNDGIPTPTQTTVPRGSNITAPAAMTRTGYTFNGWYTDAAFSGSVVSFPITNVTGNITLYAKWDINTYTVIWHVDDGDHVPTQTTVLHGSSITAPIEMAKTGYVFGGWWTMETGGTQITFPIENVTMNTELWARWTVLPPVTFIVMFNVDGGSAVAPITGIASGSTINAPIVPIKIGYSFEGWYKESALTNTWDFATDVVTDNITLYAKWEPTFTVIYNGNNNTGGTVPIDNSRYQNNSTIMVLGEGNLVRKNFTFNGWNTVDNGSGTSYTAGATFAISENTTLFAQWRLNNNAFIDSRDNQAYSTVVIGAMTWMAENLNYVDESWSCNGCSASGSGGGLPHLSGALGSWCYANNSSNCDTYGRLYTLDAALVACPLGWRLPSRTDWNNLVALITPNEGTKLKSLPPFWDGADLINFSALPSGGRFFDGSFSGVGENGNWWTSTATGSGITWEGSFYRRNLGTTITTVREFGSNRTCGFSVRCIKE